MVARISASGRLQWLHRPAMHGIAAPMSCFEFFPINLEVFMNLGHL